jgi:hypothetical protein
MKKPDEKICRAIMGLKGNNNWDTIYQWFRDSFIDQTARNSKERDDVENRWGQGRSQELADIINTIDKVETYIDNFKKVK